MSEIDSVIAEAEARIAIANKEEEALPKNKGRFFSSLGFVSGKEAIEEAETLIEDAKEHTSNIFSQFSFGGRASPKVEKKEPVDVGVVEEEPVKAEESM